mmetsp:Transcript_46393/g.92630  ORF Transcript_46393/g.92630 Transcript_46393/m.92630 type:complete len:219 (-) Transcript_46393:2272-2928(-)
MEASIAVLKAFLIGACTCLTAYALDTAQSTSSVTSGRGLLRSPTNAGSASESWPAEVELWARLPRARAIDPCSSTRDDLRSGRRVAAPPAASRRRTPEGTRSRLARVEPAAPSISPLDAPAVAVLLRDPPERDDRSLPGGGMRPCTKLKRASSAPLSTSLGLTWPWPPARFCRRRSTAMSCRSDVEAAAAAAAAAAAPPEVAAAVAWAAASMGGSART